MYVIFTAGALKIYFTMHKNEKPTLLSASTKQFLKLTTSNTINKARHCNDCRRLKHSLWEPNIISTDANTAMSTDTMSGQRIPTPTCSTGHSVIAHNAVTNTTQCSSAEFVKRAAHQITTNTHCRVATTTDIAAAYRTRSAVYSEWLKVEAYERREL